MQGRFLPLVQGRIQCFPGKEWNRELEYARKLGLDLIEWTVDVQTMNSNPMLDYKKHDFVIDQLLKYGIGLESVTCDFFMEKPPWKSIANYELNQEFLSRIQSFSKKIGNLKLVIPMVDDGSPPNTEILFEVVFPLLEESKGEHLAILFESDYEPRNLSRLLTSLPTTPFGVNLDIGNSTSLGWEAEDEVLCLNELIENVHIKDRIKGGGSVRLGEGDADFLTYLTALQSINYRGNFILQTARSKIDKHYDELALNLEFFKSALVKAGFN